jgi:hypothetical protein
MAKYPFLSDQWMVEARRIRDELADAAPAMPQVVKMNQVITAVPFGSGTVQAHMDTTSGTMEMDLGHLDGADVTVTLDYDTAKAIFVEGNPQVGMQAFMAGKIKIDGDLMKLMTAMQGGGAAAAPDALVLAQRIKDITE